MDATEITNINPVYNHLYDLFNGNNNQTSLSLHKEKKTVIKYTKMPEHDAESPVSWQMNTQPRVRRVTDLPQEQLHTTNSVKTNCYYPKSSPYCKSGKRKIISIENEKAITPITNSGYKEANSGAETGSVKHHFKKPGQINKTKNPVIESQSKSKKLISNADIPINKRNSVKKENSNSERNKITINREKYKCTLEKSLAKKIWDAPKTYGSRYNNKCLPTNGAIEIEKKDNTHAAKNNKKKTLCIDKSCGTDILFENKNVATDDKPEKKSVNIETIKEECIQNMITSHYDKKDECQINSRDCLSQFDSLCIPNIKLKKEKSMQLVEDKPSDALGDYSILNLETPALTIAKQNDITSSNNNESSYIISRATVTYTTEQKFDFEVVGSKNIDISDFTPVSRYPLNVVSVVQKEIKRKKRGLSKTIKSLPNQLGNKTVENINDCGLSIHETKGKFIGNQLIKPSDVISTIIHNNNLFANSFISEQFQKELDFIDSFIESLQYLENCSISKKTFTSQIQRKFYGFCENKKFHLNKQQNNNIVDYHTNTKNLSLLNMLIRDEQRRAKNLLFVLKMREDALKNFTKSQILWLENKKKQENTDSTTLKKKQRGALLRLQQECGEMERIRKSLLSLSEKRKSVLLKTKKNIELKLSMSEEHISNSNNKKKIRNSSMENMLTPLKCYTISDSSNNESSVSKDCSKIYKDKDCYKDSTIVTSVEKSIQTGDSILGTLLDDQTTYAAAESFVIVDGGYLNIIFQNLTLPKMFFEGKRYEVNEEALSNILTSSNNLRDNVSDTETIRKFVEQMENCDSESIPSTARSLVDELDKYYKDMENYEQHTASDNDASESDETGPKEVIEDDVNDMFLKTDVFDNNQSNLLHLAEDDVSYVEKIVDNNINQMSMLPEENCTCIGLKVESNFDNMISPVININVSATESPMLYELSSMPGAGNWQSVSHESSNRPSTSIDESTSLESDKCSETIPLGVLPPPAVSEAEELRRQQLAIELEIKAIEQQQSLVVREIPDKPPPPYMPPSDKRKISSIRRFTAEHCLESKVKECLQVTDNKNNDTKDAFEELIKDFCIEKSENLQSEVSDNKPWNSYNMVPTISDKYNGNIHKQIAEELREVLGDVTPNAMAALGNKRSERTDEILYSEWRRCEKEWTSLDMDESHVKNQLFESIFEKILSDSINDYKKTVLEGNIRTDVVSCHLNF